MLRIGPADHGIAVVVELEPVGAVLGDFLAPLDLEGQIERNAFAAPRVGQIANSDVIHSDSFRGRFAPTTMAELSAAGNGGGQGRPARAPKGAAA